MSEIERIQDQLKRSFAGGAWHGPSVQELLRDVSAPQAAARPVPGAHSIWEIVSHIAAWEGVGRRRLSGDRAQIPDEEDWPPVTDTSDAAWKASLKKLEDNHNALTQQISRLDESRLDEPILDGMSTVYVTLHGVVQHNLYHAGQIAVLKKAVGEVSK